MNISQHKIIYFESAGKEKICFVHFEERWRWSTPLAANINEKRQFPCCVCVSVCRYALVKEPPLLDIVEVDNL